MNIASQRREGQPLIALALIVVLWVGGRSLLWESPFSLPFSAISPFQAADLEPQLTKEAGLREKTPILQRALVDSGRGGARLPVRQSAGLALPGPAEADAPWQRGPESEMFGTTNKMKPASGQSEATSHQILWMAALVRLPVPEKYARMIRGSRTRSTNENHAMPPALPNKPRRWSFDFWAFYRSGGGGGNAGPLPATYGASQFGGVMRYRLTGKDRFEAKAYWRVTKAFDDQGGGDIAAGLSARPIEGLPVSMQGELRVSRLSGGTEVRPAALLVTELPPASLPFELQAEIYAQAGYVGGDFATPFADGQARIEREVASFDLGTIRVGAGAWGGAQKGAARADAGPSASLLVPLAQGTARLSFDYRHRIAGNASPPSGAAITLSTSF